MSHSCARTRNPRRLRGFSLIEAMISLLLLVVVMVVTLSLLFSMRSFAERQASKTAPRQTSRQAIDYLSYFAGGAADLNVTGTANNPNAIVTYWRDGSGVIRQASFNNLSGSPQVTYGQPGTDIITLAVPINPIVIRVGAWGGFNTTATTSINYTAGCSVSSTKNNDMFKLATGAHPDPADPTKLISDLLLAKDPTGSWGYYRISAYDASPDCSRPGAALQVVSNMASTARIENPAGQPTLVDPVTLVAGIQFVSFRVRQNANGVLNLEQKQGIFDPSTDNPGTAFFPIVEDVEDFQVAWLYNQPPAGGATIYATSTDAFPTGATGVTGGVPPQGGQGGVAAFDVTRVAGLRISIVARSRPLRLTSLAMTTQATATRLNLRPAVEDRPVGAIDGFDHQRITTTVMLRNRMLGY